MVIVSFIKHFDGNTKGTYTAPTNDLVQAAWMTRDLLLTDARDENVDTRVDPSTLFTLTKAELVVA